VTSGVGDEVRGPAGSAERLKYPADPPHASIVGWLITAPVYHPAWSQYLLSVIHLRPVTDVPEPILQHDGMTHELMVLALNPEGGQLTAEVVAGPPGADWGYLTPVNIALQHTATDAEMIAVADLATAAVVHGQLNPETADAPDRVRENWLAAVTKTLAHIRGETHAP
jgi:hypothetical protein